jgi:predicted nucleic acid-binding protein
MSALPAGNLLFDTVVYIRFSRAEKYGWLNNEALFRRTILTTVVAAELYAGASRKAEKQALDELCRLHRAQGHFSTPSETAWVETGVLLRRASDVFGELMFASHFRDLLIAIEANRSRATLVTENVRDFERWKSVLASAGKTLRVYDATTL